MLTHSRREGQKIPNFKQKTIRYWRRYSYTDAMYEVKHYAEHPYRLLGHIRKFATHKQANQKYCSWRKTRAKQNKVYPGIVPKGLKNRPCRNFLHFLLFFVPGENNYSTSRMVGSTLGYYCLFCLNNWAQRIYWRLCTVPAPPPQPFPPKKCYFGKGFLGEVSFINIFLRFSSSNFKTNFLSQ